MEKLTLQIWTWSLPTYLYQPALHHKQNQEAYKYKGFEALRTHSLTHSSNPTLSLQFIMAYSKALIFAGLLFAVGLAIASEVSARELLAEAETSKRIMTMIINSKFPVLE